MNMGRIRQILETRRQNKAPPLLPPKSKKPLDPKKPTVPREIVDIHVQIRNLCTNKGTAKSIICLFSESDDGQNGPWKVSTGSEIMAKEQNIELPSVFALEFQFERCQYIKLDICDWTDYSAKSLGYTIFSTSELVVRENQAICREVVNDDNGEVVGEVYISCTIRPKPNSVFLQFGAKNISKKSMQSSNAMIFFELYAVESNKQRNLLYKSETIKYAPKLLWRLFNLHSTELAEREIEVYCYYRDAKVAKVTIGMFTTTYHNLKHGNVEDNTYTLTDNPPSARKEYGTFELVKCQEISVSSFLDYIAAGALLNFAVAIDFSRPDHFISDEYAKNYVADVELAVKALGESFREFSMSSTYAGFGFAAKIPPQFRESQEFCLNLETDPSCRGLDGILNAFKHSLANVQPVDTAHLSHVIYYVAKLAQNYNNRTPGTKPSYFVLAIITRGVFDDLKETIQSIIFASRAPISLIFVGIGDSDLSELERLGTAGTKMNFQGRKPERDCVQYVSITKCRQEESKYPDLKALIAERGLSSIPWQMTSWMTKNGLRPKHLPPMIASSSGPTVTSTPPLQKPFRGVMKFFSKHTNLGDQAFVEPDQALKWSISHPTSSEMGYLRLGSDPYVNPNSPRGKSPRRSRRFDFGSESCLADDPDTYSIHSDPSRRIPSVNSLVDDSSPRFLNRHPTSMAALRSYSIQTSTARAFMGSATKNRQIRFNLPEK
uniref:Copine C-terminal domain-containing protein n=1 Tax=Acrobeloides nanus TaxID=290746 RepID=A0A914EJK5_9BILA